jgi:hypothetical protein
MNQTFSLTRFSMLAGMHWMENRKRYYLFVLATTGVLIAWYSFVLAMFGHDSELLFIQFATYYWGLYFIGLLYASTLFAGLNSKPQAISYLSVPASHLEKSCCAILFGVVGFFVVYTLLFYIVDIPMVRIYNELYPGGLMKKEDAAFVYNIFTAEGGIIPERDLHLFLISFFSIQAVFILGSVYFSRYAFIKATVAILLFALVVIVFITKVVQEQLPEHWHISDMIEWALRDAQSSRQMKVVRLSEWTERLLKFGLIGGVPVFFWCVTYFRLKEKEV